VIYSLNDVSKIFPHRSEPVEALRRVSLQVRPGEQIALLGQSGAGKTTLFRLLNGTLQPSAGSLFFDGQNTASLSNASLRAMRRRVGTIYQQHNLVPSLTALENTLCGALGRMSLLSTLRGMVRPARTDTEFALHALELVGLADKHAVRADELSGGQQQRLAAARVLMQSPDVVLADEPTASLDPELEETMTSLLIGLASERRKTLIMAVHKVDLAKRLFPRVVGLRAGSLSFDLPPSEVCGEVVSGLYARNGNSTGEHTGDRFHYNLRCAR
jgi:phosphonate transport system ATP-binding protein